MIHGQTYGYNSAIGLLSLTHITSGVMQSVVLYNRYGFKNIPQGYGN